MQKFGGRFNFHSVWFRNPNTSPGSYFSLPPPFVSYIDFRLQGWARKYQQCGIPRFSKFKAGGRVKRLKEVPLPLFGSRHPCPLCYSYISLPCFIFFLSTYYQLEWFSVCVTCFLPVCLHWKISATRAASLQWVTAAREAPCTGCQAHGPSPTPGMRTGEKRVPQRKIRVSFAKGSWLEWYVEQQNPLRSIPSAKLRCDFPNVKTKYCGAIFKYGVCHLLAEWLFTSYFASLSLGFPHE